MEKKYYWTKDIKKCPKCGKELDIKDGYKTAYIKDNGELGGTSITCSKCKISFIEFSSDAYHKYYFEQKRTSNSSIYLEEDKRYPEIAKVKKNELMIEKNKYYSYLFENYDISLDVFQYALKENREIYSSVVKNIGKRGKELGTKSIFYIDNDNNVDVPIKDKLSNYFIDTTRQYFLNNYTYDGKEFILDDEQVKAVAIDPQYLLVSARAGSGKTRVIVAKIMWLLDHEGIKQNEIMSLAFNRNVPEEIDKRLNESIKRKNGKTEEIHVSKTFHALAYKFAGMREGENGLVISDNNTYDRSHFIEAIISYLCATEKSFSALAYEGFRKELMQVGRNVFKSEDDYYRHVRSSTYGALNGEIVKSKGEKWIADFLFEHGIKYRYEQTFYTTSIKDERYKAFLDWNCIIDNKGKSYRKNIKPDFYLCDYKYVWEHWGINEKAQPSEKASTKSALGVSWESYKYLMEWKREFWNGDLRNNIDVDRDKYVKEICDVNGLIETSINDMNCSREEFESFLKYKLENEYGIKCNKRNQDELVKEVWEKQIKRFNTMMVSFVDKAEQHYPSYTIEELKSVVKDLKLESGSREEIFTKLGLRVLEEYYKQLPLSNKPKELSKYNHYMLDFNQLMIKATEQIRLGKFDSDIMELKYLLIDEYQDFSQLFFDFIKAILERNNKIKLFCVGDSWQAINRFMGSDTKYFDQFSSYFSDGVISEITTNYRSREIIVCTSNNFMKKCCIKGTPSKCFSTKYGGRNIETIETATEFIAHKESFYSYDMDSIILESLPLKMNDSEKDKIAKIIKRCVSIIKDYKGKEILILSRTNDISNGYNCLDFQNWLRKTLAILQSFDQDDQNKIKVRTIHKTKGSEADMVIILNANKGTIPLIHPDTCLYKLFGENEDNALLDEEKLFYVAITRAKENLFLLYEENITEFYDLIRPVNRPTQI